MPPLISPARAFAIASSWGSYVHGGDPGSCFYSFHYNDGRPVTESHRNECLAYLQSIRHLATSKVSKRELNELERFLLDAPLYATKVPA